MGLSSIIYHPRAPPACTSGRGATAGPLPRGLCGHSAAAPSSRRAAHDQRYRRSCRAATPSDQAPWGAAPVVSLVTPAASTAGDDEATATAPAAEAVGTATGAGGASVPQASRSPAAPVDAGPQAAVADGGGGGGGPVPWLALQPPFTYMASAESALSDTQPCGLSPMWKLLLLSDGSVTRHLQLLSGAPVTVECLSMAPVGSGLEGCPPGTHLIPGPRVQRQVVLRCNPKSSSSSSTTTTTTTTTSSSSSSSEQADEKGVALVYAASWWAADTVDSYLRDRSQPIWISLSQGHVELYREVHALFRGQAPPQLEEIMGCKGPFWGRHYVFWSAGKPLTLIYEVFSPRLGAWLGPQAAAGSGGGWAGGELEEGGELQPRQ